MRLSTIIELLLIFLLIAFAAYGRVIVPESSGFIEGRNKKMSTTVMEMPSLKQATDTVNKFCTCNENICNCCRKFIIPIVQFTGPTCASLKYMQDDKLALQLSVGENILASNVVNGTNPVPICFNLPGGYSKFCSKIYSIKRESDKQHFKSCLGLELRSGKEVEATLRLSCFRFGPDGLRLRPAEPLPLETSSTESTSTTNEDDDDDDFGLYGDDDDDDDYDDEEEEVTPDSPAPANPQENEDDYGDFGLSAIFDFFGSEDTDKKKPTTTTTTALPSSFVIPILPITSTTQSPISITNDNNNKIDSTSGTGLAAVESSSTLSVQSDANDNVEDNNENEDNASDFEKTSFSDSTDYPQDTTDDTTNLGITERNQEDKLVKQESNKIVANVVKQKVSNKSKVKKTNVAHHQIDKKKVSLTSQSANAIKNDGLKPANSNSAINNHHKDNEENEDDEDDDDDEDSVEEEIEDLTQTSDDDEDEKKETEVEDDEEEEEEENTEDEDDESEEEEDAVLSALVDDDHENDDKEATKIVKNKNTTLTNNKKKQEDDYSYEIAELLARKQPDSKIIFTEMKKKSGRARQSKDMRF